MKKHPVLRLSTLALAVSSALVSQQVFAAEDEELAALKQPESTLSAGLSSASKSSQKFGEYTGLNQNHPYLNLSFDLRGGPGYSQNEQGERIRWSMTGDDLGLTSRSLKASVSEQGSWSLGLAYDALRHNLAEGYQTPYQGKMGGNTFTLPSGFGTAANTNALSATQLGAYQGVDVSSTRENTSLSASRILSRNLSFNFDFNHLEQSGAKLAAFGAAYASGHPTGQAISILPSPTKYQTETFTFGLNWQNEKGRLSTSYFASLFHNDYNAVYFQTFAGANVMQSMSTAPSNNLHQLNLDGNYLLASKTRLIGNLSYSRNTQNESFVVDPGMMVTAAPRSSLNGVVITQNANLKLVNQDFRNLTLSGAFKYNNRDNQTPSSIYNFNAINGTTPDVANYPNTPLSIRKMQYELAGDYRLTRSQSLRLALTREDIKRWCNDYATNATYIAGTNCVVATGSTEDKLETAYRIKATDDIDFKLGFSNAQRRTQSDPAARTAMIRNLYGAGVNAGDYLGFYPYYDASRKQRQYKAGANWQATEKLGFSISTRYADDHYDDSSLGVQNGNSWGLNLDSSYAYSDKGSVSIYASQQYRERNFTSQGTAGLWTNKLKDDDLTLGLGFKHSGLGGSRFNVAADLNYIIANTAYSTEVPYLSTCSATGTLTCGDWPEIKTHGVQLKLGGSYDINKHSGVRLQYIYSHLSAADYYYNAYQYGYTPSTVLATNQQTGSHTVHLFGASYEYRF
jgi:MtrB/PioB family decaheme-associated outer membrane protein